ncbi:MAG: hypothetical protein KJ630_23570 [Proteobacteria bacterium]|nr:hypothetical protein [Pseudomonadota bacterium]
MSTLIGNRVPCEAVFEIDGVIHYCVANMPGVVPVTLTMALTNATLPYAVLLANKGWRQAALENKGIRTGLNIIKGKVTCKGVAEAFDLAFTPVEEMI